MSEVSKETKQLVEILKKQGAVEDENSELVLEAILEEIPKEDLLKLLSK